MRVKRAAIPDIALRIVFLRINLGENAAGAATDKTGFDAIFLLKRQRFLLAHGVLRTAIHHQTAFGRGVRGIRSESCQYGESESRARNLHMFYL